MTLLVNIFYIVLDMSLPRRANAADIMKLVSVLGGVLLVIVPHTSGP